MFDFFKNRIEEKNRLREEREEDNRLKTEKLKEKERLKQEINEKERIEQQRKQKERIELEKIRNEEEQRKINELVKEQYKKDVKNMSFKLGEYTSNIMNNVIPMCDQTVDKAFVIDFKKIEKFFKFVYRETYSITKLDEFRKYAQNNMRKIILEQLEHDFKYNYEEEYYSDKDKLVLKNLLQKEFDEQIEMYDFKNYTYNILNETKEFHFENKLLEEINKRYEKENGEIQDKIINSIDSDVSIDTKEIYKPHAKYVVSSLICLYSFLMTIMFLVILSRQKKDLLKNVELFKIADNLYGQFDDEEALEKLYPIYEGLYNDTLTGLYIEEPLSVYNKQIIGVLITFSCDNMKSYRGLMTLSLEKEAMEKGLLENVETINCEVLKEIMYKFINNKLGDVYRFGYYYLFILFEYREKIKGEDLLYYIWKLWGIEVEVKDKKKKEDLIKEKERFLNCDFTKERNIENDKLYYENIIEGIEFEDYLKNIFEKLGYKVEGTKTTGDQGADLILMKEGIKTVVQAKYYSQPVGNKAVQEVVSAIKYYNANCGMVVTNNYYTKSAIELAEANEIKLIDKDILEEMRQSLFNKQNGN